MLLLVGGFVLCCGLLLLAFLCRRRRWVLAGSPLPKSCLRLLAVSWGGQKGPRQHGGVGQPLILLSPRRKPAAELNCGIVKGNGPHPMGGPPKAGGGRLI